MQKKNTFKDHFEFCKAGFMQARTGALFRSSDYVVKRVASLIKDKKIHQIVEYGPGDGVMTRELLKHLAPDGKMLAVEINPKFVEILKKIPDPRLRVVNDLMQNVSQNIESYDFDKVDLVISSIPFSLLSEVEREDTVRGTDKILNIQGTFIVFHQYSKIMQKPMEKFFPNVNTHFEPRNFLPCFIFCAKK